MGDCRVRFPNKCKLTIKNKNTMKKFLFILLLWEIVMIIISIGVGDYWIVFSTLAIITVLLIMMTDKIEKV